MSRKTYDRFMSGLISMATTLEFYFRSEVELVVWASRANILTHEESVGMFDWIVQDWAMAGRKTGVHLATIPSEN